MSNKEHPLLCTGQVVRNIRVGRQTQDRRPMKPQPTIITDDGDRRWRFPIGKKGYCEWDIDSRPRLCALQGMLEKSPFGKPGDVLWVREHWGYHGKTWEGKKPDQETIHVRYWADKSKRDIVVPNNTIEMPQNFKHPANYDKLDEIDQSIVDADLIREWWLRKKSIPSIHMHRWACRLFLTVKRVWVERVQDITDKDLWDSLYPGSWDRNDMVWCTEFEVKNRQEFPK